ncbi:hypothetical protein DPX16_15114 [Anabarilius grahami]|uniref:Interleukin-7 receptor subunit alpha n=1 Tax=Anabarilius grahami TaxID=495550 RepID=A0A3N0YXK8_ANAGA|nr:hypothetical protein DPX16_15114 [Anabarilius grahami]
MEDTEEGFIWFEHSHEYVSNPSFQVEIWGDKLANKPISATINYRNFSISRDRLGRDGVYYTRVRAKPVHFFDGDWSKWSSTASFTITTNSTEPLKITSRSSLHITIGFSIFLVLIIIIILGVLLWRMHPENIKLWSDICISVFVKKRTSCSLQSLDALQTLVPNTAASDALNDLPVASWH